MRDGFARDSLHRQKTLSLIESISFFLLECVLSKRYAYKSHLNRLVNAVIDLKYIQLLKVFSRAEFARDGWRAFRRSNSKLGAL